MFLYFYGKKKLIQTVTDINKCLSYKYQGSGEILHMPFKSACTDLTNIQGVQCVGIQIKAYFNHSIEKLTEEAEQSDSL